MAVQMNELWDVHYFKAGLRGSFQKRENNFEIRDETNELLIAVHHGQALEMLRLQPRGRVQERILSADPIRG